ncbi:MAG: polysaccharide lyase [Pirellulales bacterium]|nr:polysaccharide lyase [Pirellulales bacterium]
MAIPFAAAVAFAAYPKVPKDVHDEANAKLEALLKRSDEIWERILPAVRDGEAKGKPYIPWAAKPEDLPQAEIPAFPGAQGGGMYSFGGRGGKVYVVKNLNDSGPGSFREALEAGGPRTVVFNVAGIIPLKSRIIVRAPYITIDGSSAPGDGVCIAGDTVELETHDVIIRHMRFRRGATWVGDRNDSIGGNPIGNIMIDHVSASWGLDENMSMYRHMYSPPDGSKDLKLPTVNITIQNSIFSECLDTYEHSFGSTIGGYNSTFHHNLWACNTGRNASVGMIYDFTFANNVVYNWRHRTVDGGDHRSYYSIINNYFKPGPTTPTDDPAGHRFLKPESRRSPHFNTDFGKAYVAGNIMAGNDRVTKDNWDGGVQVDAADGYDPKVVLPAVKIEKPYPHSYLEIEPAEAAYESVLANCGATLPKRDAVDERVVTMVRTGTVTYEEGKGIITDVKQVGGYPDYQGQPYADADADGMPDAWESAHDLNPQDSADAASDLNENGYTNIEEFLYELDPRTPTQRWKTPRTYIDLFWNVD